MTVLSLDEPLKRAATNDHNKVLAELRLLVRQQRFLALPRADQDSSLILCRWWTGGYADVIALHSEHDAEVQRFAQMSPQLTQSGRLWWRDRGPARAIIGIVREIGPPNLDCIPLRLHPSTVNTPQPMSDVVDIATANSAAMERHGRQRTRTVHYGQ